MNKSPFHDWLAINGKSIFYIGLSVLAASLLYTEHLHGQKQEIVWSPQEKPIADQIKTIRQVPDDVRAQTTKELALQIRQLPASPNKLRLAVGLGQSFDRGRLWPRHSCKR